MAKTNKCNLREDETLAEVVKNTNVYMIKVFDIEKESGVKMLEKLLRKRLVLKKVVIVNF